MAKLTKGYPFAFQVLGYLSWNRKNTSWDNLIGEYDQYLSEYVYDKIWHELSDRDRTITGEIAKYDDYVKVQTIRETIGMAPNQFSQYRERLIRKGIVDTTKYGYMRLSLPRFKEYAIQRLEYDSL